MARNRSKKEHSVPNRVMLPGKEKLFLTTLGRAYSGSVSCCFGHPPTLDRLRMKSVILKCSENEKCIMARWLGVRLSLAKI